MEMEGKMKSPRDKIFKSTKTIIIFSIFSRILVFLKETLIASKIGCCFKTDAYFVAFAGATILAEIIGEGISTSMVPILMKIEAKEGKDKKNDYINNILHMIILLSLILVILGWRLSPIMVKILARGFGQEESYLAIKLIKLGLPMIFFILIRSVFVAFLQSNHGFKAGAKSWVYNNTVYIIYLLFFNQYGVYGLMIGGVLASLSQLFSVIPASINMGYKYSRYLNFKDIYFKEMVVFLIPIIVVLSINSINLLIDRSIASTLSKGSISYLNYADNIIQLVLGIFVTAIVTVLFPIISEEYSKDNWEGSKNIMKKGMKIISKITVPATILLIVFSEPLVKLFFERGAFGPQATKITSEILIYYALGLISMSTVLILTKIHYAIHDARTPTIYATIGVISNLVLNIILTKYMGISGIALATSISSTIVAILLVWGLKIKEEFMI